MKHLSGWAILAGFALAGQTALAAAPEPPAECQGKMRPVTLSIAVTPPNVLHTPAYVARDLGFFAKYCIDAKLQSFEGAGSASARAAVAQGLAIGTIPESAIGQGMKAKQFFAYAVRLPHVYVATEEIKTPADLKGKRLSAAGGGIGSMNWRLARVLLKSAGLTPDDAIFISQGTAGRLPGFVVGQLDGVSLHPEDVFIALQQKPGAHVLQVMAEVLPMQVSGAYGAADTLIAQDRDLLVDVTAAMIEANRAIYREKDKVVPIMVEATAKPLEAVEYAWKVETDNCVWAVNTGFDRERTAWMIEDQIANGDLEEANRVTFDDVVDESISRDALAKVGGPITIGNCKL